MLLKKPEKDGMAWGVATDAEGREIDGIGQFADGADSGCDLEDHKCKDYPGQVDSWTLRLEELAEVGDGEDSGANLIVEVYPLDANVSDFVNIEGGCKVSLI